MQPSPFVWNVALISWQDVLFLEQCYNMQCVKTCKFMHREWLQTCGLKDPKRIRVFWTDLSSNGRAKDWAEPGLKTWDCQILKLPVRIRQVGNSYSLFSLNVKGNPCLYFLIFKFVSSFLNQVFSFYNQILNFFLANMIWYCSKRIFHLRVKQLIQFKFFFQIAFILFRNNLTDIIKFIYFQFIFQNININYFLIFSLQSPKTK